MWSSDIIEIASNSQPGKIESYAGDYAELQRTVLIVLFAWLNSAGE